MLAAVIISPAVGIKSQSPQRFVFSFCLDRPRGSIMQRLMLFTSAFRPGLGLYVMMLHSLTARLGFSLIDTVMCRCPFCFCRKDQILFICLMQTTRCWEVQYMIPGAPPLRRLFLSLHARAVNIAWQLMCSACFI